MPEGSVAYARMRHALLTLVARIPAGAVVEVATLADALAIPPRHAAYMLARLGEDEMDLLPWHRVVPAKGVFTRTQLARPRTARQVATLRSEGIVFSSPNAIDMASAELWRPPDEHRGTVWADG